MSESTPGGAIGSTGAAAQTNKPPLPANGVGSNWGARVLEQLAPCLDEGEALDRLGGLLHDWVPHDAHLVARVAAGEPAHLEILGRHGFAGGPIGATSAVAKLVGRDPLGTTPLRIDDLAQAPAAVQAVFQPYGVRSLVVLPLAGED